MKTIRHTVTLFSYDGPQVFEARKIGRHAEGDDVFEAMPWADVLENPALTPAQEQ